MSDLIEAKNPVKATRTTFRIVEALKELGGAGVTELADYLDLPKSSVHNYLATLAEDGYVMKEDRTYHVGLRFLDLGTYARTRYELYHRAKPEVRELAEETGELANLLVEQNGRGIYIYRERGERAVSVDSYTGHHVTLHNTALGKAILAHYPRERVEEILDYHGMPAETDKTVTDRDELFETLERVRERGVAFDDEERITGLRCVAVPILRDGYPVGAMSVSAPLSRMNSERFEGELPQQLRNVASVVELNLTYA